MPEFQIAIKGSTGTINTIPFDPKQKEKMKFVRKGKKSYNRAGAMEEAQMHLNRWNASDQFVDQQLVIREV